MASDEPWPVSTQVHIRSDDATTIATHDLHRNPRSSFQTATNVTAVPCHAKRNLWVDPNGRQHRASILYTWSGRRSQHREACDSDQLESHQKDASLAYFVGVITSGDSEEASTDVGWDRHELRIVGGVSHILYDGRQEKRETVDGTKPSHAYEHEDIDFPVSQRLVDVFHIKVI